jgi:hypothetical protein
VTARTIVLNPIEPALLSLRSALGVDLDLSISFKKQDQTPVDPTPLQPQLALLPRSRLGVYPYDITASDPANGVGTVSVPGTVLIDPNGYNIELYQRRTATNPSDPPVAVGLLAKGVLRLEGSAYMQTGPLSMINIPVVVGPPGPQGIPGVGIQGIPGPAGPRGSWWTTGNGPPTATVAQTGDLYLDELTADVWKWDGSAWTMGSF